ncbi:hypothetical protein J7M23_04775 [Candidatus Sumerlaeota bacterium]|nr:hypothetical protein [Candidatus Sumerlaeota bacterium]
MKRVIKLFSILLITSLTITGCTYLRARGNDALDIIDVGITITDKWSPDFGIYADFFSLTPTGFTHIDGKMIGIGTRQAGLLDYKDDSWGVLVWGSERRGSGKFNPLDPHQARRDQQNAETRPRFNNGVIRMILKNNASPLPRFFECDHGIHLGWIGVYKICRPLDLIDFILGWTTLDILGDDHITTTEPSSNP